MLLRFDENAIVIQQKGRYIVIQLADNRSHYTLIRVAIRRN